MRELTAYREDVVILLRSLIPETASGIGHKTITKNDTILCSSCMVTLTHYLYYSPTRFEPYLSEVYRLHSTVPSIAIDADSTLHRRLHERT